MMSYRVIAEFSDAQDNYRIYRVGDSFPCSCKSVSEKRIKELLGNDNAAKKPLIEKVVEKADDEIVVKSRTKKSTAKSKIEE